MGKGNTDRKPPSGKTSDFGQEMSAIQTALEAIASIEEGSRAFALETIANRLKIKSPVGDDKSGNESNDGQSGASSAANESSDLKLTPKQFIAKKKPNSESQQIACLAYYLTYFRDQSHFKTADLTALNIESAARKISNASRASDSAVWQYNYLAQAGKGNRQITPFGEEIVNALPDIEKVRQLTAENKSPRRKTAKKTKSKKKESTKL